MKCKDCMRYHAQGKPIKKGGSISIHRGHCLAKTVYASNRPGKEVLPVGAKTAVLPNGRHKIVMVHEDEVKPNCINAKAR